jgi:Flp pilus assembly protein TadD
LWSTRVRRSSIFSSKNEPDFGPAHRADIVADESAQDARLTKELGREVCRRTASTADVEGSVSSLGSQYVLGLNAVNCHSGDVLAQEQVTANGKEQVLKALGAAVTRLREKLGESLASVQKYDAPLENVTTPSLEALQAYSLGCQTQLIKGDDADAIPFFKRAVGLDPNSAMAYARRGLSYDDLGETEVAAENMRKAQEFRERTSQQKKLFIASYYEVVATGNLEKATSSFELWAQTYPNSEAPLLTLTGIHASLGRFERALAVAQQALRVSSGSGVAYTNLVSLYLQLNRLDEAKAAVLSAQANHVDNPFIYLNLYWVDFLAHDAAGMDRIAAALMGKSGYEDELLHMESDTTAYGGEFAKAR